MAKTAKLRTGNEPEMEAESVPEMKAEPTTETKTTKSIVPAKYAGRYKSGGSDNLAEFIKAQCKDEKGEFSFAGFFLLCRANKLPEEKVAHYEAQIAEKRHGAQGRARMTLRNMLATIARKDGQLVGNDGETHSVTMPKVALAGAAATAKAGAEGAESAPQTL